MKIDFSYFKNSRNLNLKDLQSSFYQYFFLITISHKLNKIFYSIITVVQVFIQDPMLFLVINVKRPPMPLNT